MRSLLLAPAAVLAFALSACTTYRDDLARSQRAFEDNQHERALAILRMLEPDTRHLQPSERARYAYLRGMTDFRVGYKADARHWLAVAKAMDEQSPGILDADWRTRLDQSLAELDALVWGNGMESVTNAKARTPPRAKRPAEAVDEPPPAEEEEQPAPKPAPRKKKPIDDDE
jgi:hypothetical protein